MSDFNFAALVIGPPQYGKTTVMRELVVEHLRTHASGIALVHDPNRQFRDFCAVYEDVAQWSSAIVAASVSGRKFPRGASIGGDAGELRDAAIALGRARNSAGNTRIPIMLAYDESSLIGDSGSSYIDKRELALLSNRRHWGIAPVYNAQRITSLTDAFYAMATRVCLFAQPSEKETNKGEERIGLPPGALADLVGAPPHTYRRWDAGRGLV